MKKRWKHFKLLTNEVTVYNPRMWGWFILNMVTTIGVPFAQLLLSAKVISWLTSGLSINTYLSDLAIWMGVIIILSGLKQVLDLYIEMEHENFRIHIMSKLMNQLSRLDYPLIISDNGQKNFSESLNLVGHTGSLFGRFLKELSQLISTSFAVIIYLYLIFEVEPFFLLITILLIIGLGLFKISQKRLAPKINEQSADNHKKVTYLRNLYGDSRVAKDIRLYQMTAWFKEISEEVSQKFKEIKQPKVRLTLFENSFLSTGIIILTVLAYIRSTQLVMNGQLQAADFVVYVGAVTLLADTATQFVQHLSIFDQDLLEAEYYENFINQTPVFNHGKGIELPKEEIEIELRNVSYTYPGNNEATLKNMNIVFHPNENIAIVGENGAGKTTLIKLITGLLLPDEGEIFINGRPQKDFNIKEYYGMFSTVFQDIHLLTYTIRDTILQGLPYDEKHYQKVLKQSGMDKIIRNFPKGDETTIVRKVYQDSPQLSGGQIQKLKLAQALYKNSEVLILDEPTAALDPLAEYEVYQDYLEFSKNKLSFFISHRLSSTRFCDRIVYLKQGEITEVGTHQELLEAEQDYYNLYEAQAYYYRENIQPKEEAEIETGGVL